MGKYMMIMSIVMKSKVVIWTLYLLTKNEFCLVGFLEFFWLEK